MGEQFIPTVSGVKKKRIKVVDLAYTNKKQFANLQLYLHSKQPELNKNLKCQHLKCRGER